MHDVTTLALSFFSLAGKKDNHKSLDEFKFQPVEAPWEGGKKVYINGPGRPRWPPHPYMAKTFKTSTELIVL